MPKDTDKKKNVKDQEVKKQDSKNKKHFMKDLEQN